MNACRFAGVPAMVMRLTQVSSTRMVCCHESSAHIAGRGSCSAAMALSAAQQCSHGTQHSAAVLAHECGILAEAVPCEHRGDDTPRGPHGDEHGLEHKLRPPWPKKENVREHGARVAMMGRVGLCSCRTRSAGDVVGTTVKHG